MKLENFEKIIELVNSNLSDKEKQEIYNLIENENELKEDYEDIQLVKKALELYKEYRIKNELKSSHSFDNSNQGGMMKTKSYFTGIAASIAAILILAVSYVYLFDGNGNEAIFKEYFTFVDIDEVSRGSIVISDPDYTAGMEAYKNRDFETAKEKLNLFLESGDDIKAKLYLGISFLETGGNEKAESIFNGILNKNAGIYLDHAQWYLILTMVKLNKIEAAIKLIDKSLHDGHKYYKEMVELKSKLNKME